jgi:hypothetical protein
MKRRGVFILRAASNPTKDSGTNHPQPLGCAFAKIWWGALISLAPPTDLSKIEPKREHPL